MMSWMRIACRRRDEDSLVYSRRWRPGVRKRFNDLDDSLCRHAQVKRWLTFAGHLAWMDSSRIVKQVIDDRSLLE